LLCAAMCCNTLLIMGLGSMSGRPSLVGEGPDPHNRQATHITATLVSENEGLVAGGTSWLGVDLKIDKGWHTYWPGMNDTGTPPAVELKLPEGFTAGEIVWPAPVRHLSPGNILDHIYEDRVLLMIPVQVSKDAKAGKASITAECKWVVCADVCVAEKATTKLEIQVAAVDAKPTVSEDAPKFVAARKRVPVPLRPDSPVKARVDGRTLLIEAEGTTTLSFMPLDGSPQMPHLAKEGESKTGKLAISIEPDPKSPPEHVKGVIEVRDKGAKEPAFYSVDLPVPSAPTK
jgi:DsbC/DsbD-like thiol-disulfide interchange protein